MRTSRGGIQGLRWLQQARRGAEERISATGTQVKPLRKAGAVNSTLLWISGLDFSFEVWPIQIVSLAYFPPLKQRGHRTGCAVHVLHHYPVVSRFGRHGE